MGNSFKTILKQTSKDFKNRSVNPPLVRTSTMVFKSMSDLRKTQKKVQTIQGVVILIMEDKALQPHLN